MEKYSFGIGDRFAHQGEYQLKAFQELEELGVKVTPVWNKSFREHKTVGTVQQSVRDEADNAVAQLGFQRRYLVDADHINFKTVADFIPTSDFFTIDVADSIGRPLESQEKFLEAYQTFLTPFSIEGITTVHKVSESELITIGNNFYRACKEASKIYELIKEKKAGKPFCVEVSMDEVEESQTPLELFFILKFLADFKVPVNTIAPKFAGRFNKGVDYEGNLEKFEEEFENELLVIAHAIKTFGLPENLKLSVHTGSDKFSLYPIINKLIKKHEAGLHLKTAGTTWLEELIGLAEAGGSGLKLVKSIANTALQRYDELTAPYSTVINIDKNQIPQPETLQDWGSTNYVNALKHDTSNPQFNASLRQLLHTAYKLAAEENTPFFSALKEHQAVIGKNVKENIFERHLKPLFL